MIDCKSATKTVSFVKRNKEYLKYSYIQCFSLNMVTNLKSKGNDSSKAPGVLGSANISCFLRPLSSHATEFQLISQTTH
jgi:hypothetical protein